MRRPRPIPLAVAILALIAIPVFCTMMAQRIARYNDEHGRVVYVFGEVNDAEFIYAERQVTIARAPAPGPGEYPMLEVAYGDAALSIPITLPQSPYLDQLPGLRRYEEWLKILRFAPLTDRTLDELQEAIYTGEVRDRLAIVAKSIRPGVNPETWGRVWRKEWIFDFWELLPEGGFRHERFAYPTARSIADTEQPRTQGGIPELDSRSWQFQAADLLMPEGSAPRIIAGDSPLVAASWTFPATIVSVFAATAALLIAFAPSRPAQPDPQPEPQPEPAPQP